MNEKTQAWVQEMIKKTPPWTDQERDEVRRILRLKKPDKPAA